jgi:hypothetical protein
MEASIAKNMRKVHLFTDKFLVPLFHKKAPFQGKGLFLFKTATTI